MIAPKQVPAPLALVSALLLFVSARGGIGEVQAVLPPEIPWRGKSLSLVLAPAERWVTPTEEAGFQSTPRYDETIAYLKRLVAAARELRLVSLGYDVTQIFNGPHAWSPSVSRWLERRWRRFSTSAGGSIPWAGRFPRPIDRRDCALRRVGFGSLWWQDLGLLTCVELQGGPFVLYEERMGLRGIRQPGDFSTPLGMGMVCSKTRRANRKLLAYMAFQALRPGPRGLVRSGSSLAKSRFREWGSLS
jgi:hypothetical protein